MYPRSFQALTVLAAFAAISISTTAHAQNPVSIPSDVANKAILGMQSGNYDFTHFDKTEAMKYFITEINKRSSHDLQYFKDSVNYINSQFDKIVKEDIYGANGLKALSDRGRGVKSPAGPVSSDDFINALNKFDQDSIELSQAIGKVTSIVTAFPSQQPVQGVNGVTNTALPKYGDINFGAVSDFYTGKLNELRTFLSNLPHSIMLPNGTPFIIAANSGNGLTLDAPDFQYSADTINKLKKKAKDLRTWQQDVMDDEVAPYTLKLKQMVQEFIKTYGTSERYRYDAHTPDLMERELKKYFEYFYARSFIRANYGMPIGTVCINYDKSWFNLDKMFTSNAVSFREEIITDEKDMVRCEQNYANVMNVMTARTQEVFGKGVDFLDRVNAAFTWIKGQNRLAVANKVMFDLLYKDFQEERLMYAGNLLGMKDLFVSRYKSTPEQIAFFKPLGQKYLAIINQDISDSDDDGNAWSNGPGSMTKGSVESYMSDALVALQTKETELAQAAQIDKQIRQMTMLAKGLQKKRATRGSDLVN